MTDLYTLISQFSTSIVETEDGVKNRWEGFITQGRPYPDYTDPEGQEGGWAVEPYDSQKIYLTLNWVKEGEVMELETQVMELTGFDDIATWPLMLQKNYDWGPTA